MSLPDGERPEIAMVSRIRVEVRAETMAAAEEAAFLALDHARMAGILEGIAPTIGSYTDHFFNRPVVVGSPSDPPEPWNEIGLSYYGRLSFTFEPQAVYGGLKQHGYKVEIEGDHADVDEHGVLVLGRRRPVTRDHMWEVSLLHDAADETGESILEDIRSIREVLAATARMDKSGASVEVNLDGWSDVHESGETLREAAAIARKTVLAMISEAEPGLRVGAFSVSIHVSNLNKGTLAQALSDKEYRTLIVGTQTAADTALEALPGQRTKDGFEIALLHDPHHVPDHYTLTTAEPAEERKLRGLDDN